MSIFNEFPYTNFHEMNLDYILAKVRKLTEENIKLAADFDELSKYIKDYLINNLDAALQDLIQELIESGELEQMIMDAINAIQTQVDQLKVPNYTYGVSYVKTLENADTRPVICTYNEDREAITYIAPYNDNSYIRCGDLAGDYISIANEISSIYLQHPNDITFCKDTHEIIIADLSNDLVVLDSNSLTLKERRPVSWGGSEIIGVEYDAKTNKLVLMGSIHSDQTNVLIAVADINGSVEKQFTIAIEKFHGNTYQDCYIQSLSIIHDEVNILCSSLTPGGTPGNFTLLTLDMVNENIRNSARYDYLGEAETVVAMEGQVLVYGFSTVLASESRQGAMCAVMTLVPRYHDVMDIYVDETQLLNGDGSNANPFNSLTTAIYNAQFFPNSQAIVYFKSNITKAFLLPSYYNKNRIVFQGNNYTLYIQNKNIYNIDWVFYSTNFARTGSTDRWMSFYRNSKLALYNCTMTRESGMPLFRLMECEAYLINLNVNNAADDYGVVQNRLGAVLFLAVNTITMGTAGRLINNVDGTIINMKQIPTTYTNPISGDGVVLGKNQENLSNA